MILPRPVRIRPTIHVSGLAGVILKTSVILTNLSHTAPGDIEALVVAPNQQDTLIMGNAGAGNSIKKCYPHV